MELIYDVLHQKFPNKVQKVYLKNCNHTNLKYAPIKKHISILVKYSKINLKYNISLYYRIIKCH